MSLLHLHSFGQITATADIPEVVTANMGSGAAVGIAGRYVGSPNSGIATSLNGYLLFGLPAGLTGTLYAGYALKPWFGYQSNDYQPASLGYLSGNIPTASYGNGPTSLIPVLTVTGHIAVYSWVGVGTIVLEYLTTEPVVIDRGSWHWIEISHTIQTVDGGDTTCVIKVDGETVVNVTGPAYIPGHVSDNRFFAFSVCSAYGAYGFPLCDLYICSSAGNAPFNTFLGEIQIECKLPTGDSPTYVEWTPTGGGAHYTQVDDTTPDDDTTYVAAAVNKKDAYTFPALTNTTGTVLGVQLDAAGRLVDPYGNHYQDAIVRRAGSDGSPSGLVCQDNRFLVRILHSRTVLETDPTDSSAWTIAKVNAAEFGPRRPA